MTDTVFDNRNNNTDNRIEETFDTTGLILDFMANWKWFIISVIVCLIVAYYHISTIIPTYQVTGSIYLSDETAKANKAVSFGADDPVIGMKEYIDETELEILKSRNNVIDIVDSLGLEYSYAMEGNFRNYPIYRTNAVVAKLDSVSLNNLGSTINVTVDNGKTKGTYDIVAKTWFGGVEEVKEFNDAKLPLSVELSNGTLQLTKSPTVAELNGTEIITIRNPKAAAGALSGALSLEYAQNSFNIIRLRCNTPIIEQGVDVLNVLVEFYNRQIIEDKNRSAMQTEAFILDRLVMISDELKDVENRLQDYRQANNITDLNAQAQMNLNQKSSTENQLAEVDAERSIINSIEHIVSNSNSFEGIPSVSNDQNLTRSIEAYNKKIDQLNRQLENGTTADNPLVKTMQEDLNRDKNRILQNINSVKSALNARRSTILTLDRRSSGQLSSLPPIDKGLQEIFREQQVKVNIYTYLLQKREEIALQKTLATPTARLIDNPVGGGPVAPKKSIIYFVALLIGLFIPAAIILLKRLIFPIFKDQTELERMTKLPIIGEICKADSNTENDIVVGAGVTTSIAELFRLLRNNIGFTANGSNNHVILLTSSISGEGKTFIATNLAMTYALTGKRVVVIGMDIRRPVLAHRFGLSNKRGVTTFLSGQCDTVSELLSQSSLNENLYILPAGPVPPNPNELLLCDNMKRLFAELRNNFDYIIVDSAPIGMVSDTFLILPHSDIQLFVTRASYSTKRCLSVVHKAYNSHKLTNLYILLNGVNMKSSSYIYRKYGHYYYSRHNDTYGYGYSSGKESRHKK